RQNAIFHVVKGVYSDVWRARAVRPGTLKAQQCRLGGNTRHFENLVGAKRGRGVGRSDAEIAVADGRKYRPSSAGQFNKCPDRILSTGKCSYPHRTHCLMHRAVVVGLCPLRVTRQEHSNYGIPNLESQIAMAKPGTAGLGPKQELTSGISSFRFCPEAVIRGAHGVSAELGGKLPF